jgi:2-oxoglutarate ferredoxin oxidoreductase subunit delta
MRYWRTPLDKQKYKTTRAQIYIIIERCKGCCFCVEYCPRGVLQISEKFNKKGYHYPVAIREDGCVDCDLCETLCPEFAIYSLNITDEDGAAGGDSQARSQEQTVKDAPQAKAQAESKAKTKAKSNAKPKRQPARKKRQKKEVDGD